MKQKILVSQLSAVGVVALLACPQIGLAANNTSTVLQTYYGYKSMNNASTSLLGLYGYLGVGKHSLEMAYDTLPSNKEGGLHDVTVAYSNYVVPYWRFSAGYRAADMNDVFNLTHLVRLDVQRTHTNYWGYVTKLYGMNTYYTLPSHKGTLSGYPSIVGMANGLQVSPYYGQYFAGLRKLENIYLEGTLNVQSFDQPSSTGLAIKQGYYSVGVKASYNSTRWQTTVTGLYGKNLNLVEAGGFVYHNDFFTNQYRLGVSYNYRLTRANSIQPWVKVEGFENAASSTIVGLSASTSF